MQKRLDAMRAAGPVRITVTVDGDPHLQRLGDVVTVRLYGAPAGFSETQVIVSAGPNAGSPLLAQWTKESDGTLVWRAALAPLRERPLTFDLEHPQRIPEFAATKLFTPDPAPDGKEWIPETWEPPVTIQLPTEVVVGGVIRRPVGGVDVLASFAAPVEQLIAAGAPSERFAHLRPTDLFLVTPRSLPDVQLAMSRLTTIYPPLEAPLGPSLLTVAFDDGFVANGERTQDDDSVELVFDATNSRGAAVDYLATTSVHERDVLLASGDFVDDGVICHVHDSPRHRAGRALLHDVNRRA